MKKILVLGATGAMATYLIPEMLIRGYSVTGVALEEAIVSNNNYTHIVANALDVDFLKSELGNGYDGIVDFMLYKTVEDFAEYYEFFINSCKHYIFLSTYRVYSDACPITEESPRILDVPRPDDFVTYKEYSIYKAEQEDFIRASGYKNFTIVRPAITYSKRRFQLTTLEANAIIHRMKEGKVVTLPAGAMDHQATMSWAGDVARMFAAILFNEQAFGETYTVSTAEHHTWREVADMYAKIWGLKYVEIPDEDYLYIVSGNSELLPYAKQQLYYDRCYDRVVDNSKILALMGEEQSDLTSLYDGLSCELSALDVSMIRENPEICSRMDEYLAVHR